MTASGGRTGAGDPDQPGPAFRATQAIVLNPGSEPAVSPIDGLAGTPFWTNREAVETERLPESMIVLGGGPVGCEFAQGFARFGAAVTVLEATQRLLSSYPYPTFYGTIEDALRDLRPDPGVQLLHR